MHDSTRIRMISSPLPLPEGEGDPHSMPCRLQAAHGLMRAFEVLTE